MRIQAQNGNRNRKFATDENTKGDRVSSGIKGISLRARSNRWRSTITVNHKKIALGTYDRLMDAAEARYNGELKHRKLNTDPDKSAYSYLEKHGYFSETESEFMSRAKSAVDRLFDRAA